MDVIDRTDVTLEDGAKYSHKLMENGEHRYRIVFSNGTSVSATQLSHYEVSEEKLPWQTPHHHKGKTEVYVLEFGWAAFIWLETDGAVGYECLVIPGQTKTFQPGENHNVLLGPDAEISTLIFGTPVENTLRKNNDWWPAPEHFDQLVFKAKSELIGKIRNLGLL